MTYPPTQSRAVRSASTSYLSRFPSLIPGCLLLVACSLLLACGGSSSGSTATATIPASAFEGIAIATLTPTSPAPEPTQEPSATPEPPAPTETPEPPSALPTGLSFQPPQLRQGGYSVVYLNEDAENATLSFGGLQYPMLPDGDRWWALIGVGAFAEPGLAPLSVAYTPAGGGDAVSIAQSIEIVDHEYPVENINLDPQTSALLAPDIVNNELAIRAGVLSGYTATKLWSGPFVRPAEGEISSIYGVARSYNNGPVGSFHGGTDFVGEIGAPIYAAGAGVVVFASELQVRGNTVMIDHGAGLFTSYNHLSAIEVAVGDSVAAGQPIGALGSTGLVTGPHLHWEVIVRTVEVDGELWLQDNAVGP